MNAHLNHPKANLNAAEQAITAMIGAQSFAQYESEWREYLGHIEKAWIKVERACVSFQAKFQPWQGKFQSLRKKDMLLRYLKAARDADNHSIQDLASIENGYRAINFANSNGGYIENLTISNGEIIEYSGDPIIVTDVPPRPVALPVKNNGSWYNPPTSHLGNAITTAHPTELAMLGLTFYNGFISDVEKTFFT
ncbi:hypothetical protein PS862_02881 [Pseudomonas fluorescens]|uniref:Uncharacterized protein n=1 Tax=Pseudomonas fluorescens TaxID=294 RepID=A0A5E7KPB8_PSEFL|nr:hypothetical protein [Pseudomonas fluorescens]VVP01685.1 hypothetical protein PS862_02881 [Pseudomonas fluorescens]